MITWLHYKSTTRIKSIPMLFESVTPAIDNLPNCKILKMSVIDNQEVVLCVNLYGGIQEIQDTKSSILCLLNELADEIFEQIHIDKQQVLSVTSTVKYNILTFEKIIDEQPKDYQAAAMSNAIFDAQPNEVINNLISGAMESPIAYFLHRKNKTSTSAMYLIEDGFSDTAEDQHINGCASVMNQTLMSIVNTFTSLENSCRFSCPIFLEDTAAPGIFKFPDWPYSITARKALQALSFTLKSQGWLPANHCYQIDETLKCVTQLRAILELSVGGIVLIKASYEMLSILKKPIAIAALQEYMQSVCIIFIYGFDCREQMREYSKELGLPPALSHVIEINCNAVTYSEEEPLEMYKLLHTCSADETQITSFLSTISPGTYDKNKIITSFGLYKASQQYDNNIQRANNEDIDVLRQYANARNAVIDVQQDYDPSVNYVQKLRDLVGLQSAKTTVESLITLCKLQRVRNSTGGSHHHMLFAGNPGTGKTMIAQLFAYALKQAGCLNSLNPRPFYAVGSAELIGSFQGHTTERVHSLFKEANGSVIFIDEAYDLVNQNDYGQQAINEIVRQMETLLPGTIVIFAGYPDKLKELLAKNVGLRSRIRHEVTFEDYTAEELHQIALLEFKRSGVYIRNSENEYLLNSLKEIVEHADEQTLGNARYVKNLVQHVVEIQSYRIHQQCKGELSILEVSDRDVIIREDLEKYIEPEKAKHMKSKDNKKRVGF